MVKSLLKLFSCIFLAKDIESRYLKVNWWLRWVVSIYELDSWKQSTFLQQLISRIIQCFPIDLSHEPVFMKVVEDVRAFKRRSYKEILFHRGAVAELSSEPL